MKTKRILILTNVLISLLFPLCILLANTDFGMTQEYCTVIDKKDQGTQTLRNLIEKANDKVACKKFITFKNPMRIELDSPLELSAHNLLITGADLSQNPPPPLGIVLDGRSLQDSCVLEVSTITARLNELTVYVSDKDRAVCDTDGNSILDRVTFKSIRVCRGEGPEDCDWSQAENVSDQDQDGIPDTQDRCDTNSSEVKKTMLLNGCLSDSVAPFHLKSQTLGEIPNPTQLTPIKNPNPILCSQIVNLLAQDPLGNACDGDWDNDGKLNWEDLCPLDESDSCKDATQNASISQEDSDGDGVVDAFDLCPDREGTLALGGCPADFCFVEKDGKLTAVKKSGVDEDQDGIDQACDAKDLLSESITQDSANPDEKDADSLPKAAGCSLMLDRLNP